MPYDVTRDVSQGNWQEAPLHEVQKRDSVRQLQQHLSEVKANQKRKSGIRTCNVNTTKRLYTMPTVVRDHPPSNATNCCAGMKSKCCFFCVQKRLLVFSNGDSVERAQYVWGESMQQVLDNSALRLQLRKPQKHVFTLEGELVSTNLQSIVATPFINEQVQSYMYMP